MVAKPNTDDLITMDPGILGGKPVIRGMRIPVQLIVDLIAAGDSAEDIIDAYPVLTQEDIEAAIAYAIKHEQQLTAPVH